MNRVKAKKGYKPWITEVEKEVDRIRDRLQKQAEKVGWRSYWKESQGKTQEWFKAAGLKLKLDKATGSYVVT